MEFTKKENVNTKSFSFRKRVMANALGLLEGKTNYLVNDIEFTAMLCFVNEMLENNPIVDILYTEENLQEIIQTTIEPLFDEMVLQNEEANESFEDIVIQLINYMDRQVANSGNIMSSINEALEGLKNLTIDDIKNFIDIVVSAAKVEPNKITPLVTKQEVTQDIENAKIKAMIDKFKKIENEEDITE